MGKKSKRKKGAHAGGATTTTTDVVAAANVAAANMDVVAFRQALAGASKVLFVENQGPNGHSNMLLIKFSFCFLN